MNICLIEPDPAWRELIESVLLERSLPEALHHANGIEGISIISSPTEPMIVITDIVHGEQCSPNLLDAIKKYRSAAHKVVLLSNALDDATVFKAWRGGFDGFVCKSFGWKEDLVLAVDAAREGRKFYSLSFRNRVRQLFQNPTAFFKILSDREVHIMPFIAQAMTDTQIGKLLGVSPSTVHGHRCHILAKLGLSRSCELVAWAHRTGLAKYYPREEPPEAATKVA